MLRPLQLIALLPVMLVGCNERIVVESLTSDPAAIEGRAVRSTTTIARFDQPIKSGHTYTVELEVRCRDVESNPMRPFGSPSVDVVATTYSNRMNVTFQDNLTINHLSSSPTAANPITSDWRHVQLRVPMSAPAEPAPKSPIHAEIEVSVSMPGTGTIEVRNVQLVMYPTGRIVTPGVWWSTQVANWIGAVAGPILGLLGAAIGIASAGLRRHRVALLLLGVMAAVFVPLLVTGIIAWVSGQPYEIYYLLLLPGLGGTLLPLVLQRTIRKRLHHDELRKMQALDVT